MSDQLPITTPPRRRNDLLAHVQQAFNHVVMSSSGPSVTTSVNPNDSVTHRIMPRKLEPFHHALLESGCHSAKSSPLPHRRLDKLEGVIREKPASPHHYVSAPRHAFDSPVGDIDSTDSSPAMLRKHPNNGGNQFERRFINSHQESPMPYRKSLPQQRLHHHQHSVDVPIVPPHRQSQTHYCDDRHGDCSQSDSGASMTTPIMRRRVDSDCGNCSRKPALYPKSSEIGGGHQRSASISKNDSPCSPQLPRKYASPTRSVLGEPGCFNSPIHQRSDKNGSIQYNAFANPAKFMMSESALFTGHTDDIPTDVTDTPLQPDQNIVSGWLKFRDNKRVRELFSIFLFHFSWSYIYLYEIMYVDTNMSEFRTFLL